MTLKLSALVLIILVFLSGCATTQVPQLIAPQGADYSQRVLDMSHCGALNGVVDPELVQYYYACMDKKGYKLQASE